MIPSEEYIRRRALRSPIIRRPAQKLNVLFRASQTRWQANWVNLQITVRPESYSPSYFQFQWQVPQHNGAISGGLWRAIGEPSRVEWDVYDLEILKAAGRGEGLSVVSDLQEAKLVAWEMFLFAVDERIPNLPVLVRNVICRSIDPQLSVEERLRSQDSAYQTLQECGSNITDRWGHFASCYDPATYAVWFADIADKMTDHRYRVDFSSLQDVA